jgi:hypothetical protein
MISLQTRNVGEPYAVLTGHHHIMHLPAQRSHSSPNAGFMSRSIARSVPTSDIALMLGHRSRNPSLVPSASWYIAAYRR